MSALRERDQYVTCPACGQGVFAMKFERPEVMRRHDEQAHPGEVAS